MRSDWQAYDSVADIRDRLAVPYFFLPPARDLVAGLELPAGACVLDVGTGSGVAALAALQSVGAESVIVGIDPSLGMLRVAQKKGLRWLAAGLVPGLPHPDGVFHAVLASFVVSHFRDYKTALADMVRVLRPGGRLGLTAWTSAQDEFRQLWQQKAESLVDKEVLRRATAEALPWEEWFSEEGHLEEALRGAGLDRIEVQQREYKAAMTVADFLAIREISAQARFLRDTLGANGWEQFRESLAKDFRARYRDPIEHAREVYLAFGAKP